MHLKFLSTARPASPDPERSGAVHVDFMHDARYSPLAVALQHGELTGSDIARLDRRSRDFALRVVAHPDAQVPVERTLAWYREAPSGTTAALAGAAKLRNARRVKGARTFAGMDRDEVDHVRAILTDAEAFLKNASAHLPHAFLPWVPRIGIAHLMERGLDEVQRMFAEAQSRETWNLQAAEVAFLGQLAGWTRDPDAMWEWAAATLLLPPSQPARCVVAMAEGARRRIAQGVTLGDSPLRASLDLASMFNEYVDSLPESADPEDVIALGAWLDVIEPTSAPVARSVLRALDVLKGRVAGYPYLWEADPLGSFFQVARLRQAQALRVLG